MALYSVVATFTISTGFVLVVAVADHVLRKMFSAATFIQTKLFIAMAYATAVCISSEYGCLDNETFRFSDLFRVLIISLGTGLFPFCLFATAYESYVPEIRELTNRVRRWALWFVLAGMASISLLEGTTVQLFLMSLPMSVTAAVYIFTSPTSLLIQQPSWELATSFLRRWVVADWAIIYGMVSGEENDFGA